MSFVLDALRKSVPDSIAPSRSESGWMEHCCAAASAPWLIVLAVLAAAAAGAAAQRWTRHAETAAAVQSVVVEPSPAAAAAAEMAPLVASRSLDESASRAAPSKRARGSTVASEASPRIAAHAEVPVALPKQLPQPVISGYVLGKGGTDSLAIIDGRVLRVGEEAAPGLRIEKIDANGVTFDYRGYRFRR